MRYLWGVFLLLTLCFGCKHSEEVPDGVFSPEKMQSVLWDLLNAESWARQTSNRDTTVSYSDEVKVLSKRAFQLNNVTEADFQKSYDWYTQHSQDFLNVLDSLETRVKREDSLKLELERKKTQAAEEEEEDEDEEETPPKPAGKLNKKMIDIKDVIKDTVK